MTNATYMAGRKRYARPQAMLWADGPGTLSDGIYVPSGYEEYSNTTGLTQAQIDDSFIITSDHNRAELSVSPQRLEQRKRMINGGMRSRYKADKLVISTSWNLLPSRSHKRRAAFSQTTGLSPYPSEEYTADGGAGGAEMLRWREDHKGPFWVFLSYDKYTNFGVDDNAHLHLAEYSQIVQMYLTQFDYSVAKRGGSNFDMWNISVSLEEV